MLRAFGSHLEVQGSIERLRCFPLKRVVVPSDYGGSIQCHMGPLKEDCANVENRKHQRDSGGGLQIG